MTLSGLNTKNGREKSIRRSALTNPTRIPNWMPSSSLANKGSRGSLGGQGLLSLRQRAMILVLAATTGCGSSDGLNRQAIFGTVTLDGQPISRGAILFEPATHESGTAVGATIRLGSFVISKQQGAVPGTYRVRVYSSSEKQAPPAKGQTERTPRPMVERLPARYNTRSELRADVVAHRRNQYHFQLRSSESADAH
jgi:hypothetical protein